MLFSLYVKPLGRKMHGFGVGSHSSDDTQFYISLSKSPGDVEILSLCLPLCLILNPVKMETLLVGNTKVTELQFSSLLHNCLQDTLSICQTTIGIHDSLQNTFQKCEFLLGSGFL